LENAGGMNTDSSAVANDSLQEHDALMDASHRFRSDDPRLNNKTVPRHMIPLHHENSKDSTPTTAGNYDGCLEVGVIDYALIVGPTVTLISAPTHRVENGTFERIIIDKGSLAGDAVSPLSGVEHVSSPSANSGLFSPDGFQYTTNNEMKIWDRIPLDDLEDLELPGKIEWFACPEGSITIASSKRFDYCFLLPVI
jgi:hypothetical protein